MIFMSRLNPVFTALILVVVLLGGSCTAIGNIKASVSGTAYMDGRPIQGTILLLDMNGTVVNQCRTGMNGHYQIRDVSAGKYELRFLNMQGVPFGREVSIEVRLGRPERVDLQLSASDRELMN